MFEVLLRDDWPAEPGAPVPSDAEMERKFRADLVDPDRRRRRYRATGEYIAAHSDLLLAVWDGQRDRGSASGTAAIVAAKQRGLTPGLLTVTSSFTWANTGPVLHIPARASNTPTDAAVSSSLVLLPDRNSGGHKTFRARVSNLERFNHDGPSSAEEATRIGHTELGKMLDGSGLTEGGGASGLRSRLVALASVRSQASGQARELDARKRRLMLGLCLMIAGAAVSLHLFAHWHPPQGRESAEWPRTALLTASLAFSIPALIWFLIYERAATESRRYDYRAIAEGMRVQIFWAAAGIWGSVAGNYMHRQGDELGWIRSAINSLAFPYQAWGLGFARLSPDERLASLRAIVAEWVKKQAGYYGDNSRTSSELHHLFRALGWGCALAGLLHLLLLWASHLVVTASETSTTVAVAVSAGALISYLGIRMFVPEARDDRDQNSGPPIAPSPDKRSRLHRSMVWLFPTTSIVRAIAQVTALALGIGLPFPFLLPSAGWLPTTENIWIIVLGITLVIGGVLVAWAEKSLYAEHARQYQATRRFATAETMMCRRTWGWLRRCSSALAKRRSTSTRSGSSSIGRDRWSRSCPHDRRLPSAR